MSVFNGHKKNTLRKCAGMERQWQMLFERSEFICRSGMKQIFSIFFKAHVSFVTFLCAKEK
jgi:hypothetical protein